MNKQHTRPEKLPGECCIYCAHCQPIAASASSGTYTQGECRIRAGLRGHVLPLDWCSEHSPIAYPLWCPRCYGTGKVMRGEVLVGCEECGETGWPPQRER